MEINLEISGDLLKDAKKLTSGEFEGRLSGTKGASKAAAFLAERLEEMGYFPPPILINIFSPLRFLLHVY